MTVTMLGAFERHTMPNGDEVFYRESDHSYYSAVNEKKNGTVTGVQAARLTGVSTVSAPFDWQPDGLMKWAARIDHAGVAEIACQALAVEDPEERTAALDWLRGAETIGKALHGRGLSWTQTREDRATEGTNVHKHALHALAKGEPVPDRSQLTDAEWGFAQGVMGAWLDLEPEPLYAEQVVCDLGLRVAGRLDLIANVGTERWLIDAKTSGFIPIKHHIQLAGYRGCAIECGIGAVDRVAILQVFEDGSYKLIPVDEATYEDFETAVRVYRRAADIGKAMKPHREAPAIAA